MPENWSVWIDWNKDNDFADANEQVLVKTNSAGAVTGTFTVPAQSGYGNTRMRVRMSPNTIGGPCETPYSLGETEDYTVFLKVLFPSLTLSPAALHYPAEGTSFNITLQTNCDWTVSGLQPWIVVKPVSGSAGTLTIKVTTLPNTSLDSLQATLFFSGCEGLAGQSLVITQDAAAVQFSANPSLLQVDQPSGCAEWTLITNTSWTAATTAPWVASITPASGSGNAKPEVCFEENTEPTSRLAEIVFSPDGADPVTVLLSQKPKIVVSQIEPSSPGNRITCLPNPARAAAVFVVYSTHPQTTRIELYDAGGRLARVFPNLELTPGENRIPWQTDDLPAGYYQYRCRLENEVLSGNLLLSN